MKSIYRSTKVVYNDYAEQYEVWYRRWLVWEFDQSFKFDKPGAHTFYFRNQEQAEERAVQRAVSLLKTKVIFQKSVIGL